jgi:pimeloyl-ACP methyl ester carboxylesterase
MRIRREAPTTPLPPDEWYPAGIQGQTARMVELPGRERVRLVEAGPRTGPGILLLHGWGASAYNFRHLLPLLAAARLRGIAPDLRGHGLSGKPAEPALYSSAEMVRFVLDVMDVLELGQVVVVGQSMAGALALDAMLAAQGRFAGAVLLAPIGLTSIRRVSVARLLRADRWLRGPVSRIAIELLLRRVYGTIRPFTERDVDEYWAASQQPGYLAALMALVMRFDWSPRVPEPLHSIGARVQILLGQRDKLIPAVRAAGVARSAKVASVEIVPGAGHLLAEEAPEWVVQAVGRASRRETA